MNTIDCLERKVAALIALALLLAPMGCEADPENPPVLDPPTVAAAPYADVLEGCLKVSFCTGYEYWDRCTAEFSTEFYRQPDPARVAINQYYQCVAATSDCTGVDQCHGTECDMDTYIASCDGNDLMTCYYGTVVPIECGLPLTTGDICQTLSSGAGLCSDRECTASEQGEMWCSWDVHHACGSDGYLIQTQCPLTAYDSCAPIWGPCGGTQEGACVWGEYPSHCEGSVQWGCDSGTDLIWYHDCSKNPLKTQCLDTGDGAYCVVPDGAPLCDPSDPPTCDGDVIHFCAGQQRSFDCASIGMLCGQSMSGIDCNPNPF